MINLSKKAADRFRINWNSLNERKGDFWKIDITMIGKTPMLLLIHEYTLFTLVRKKIHFETIFDVASEIRLCCSWYKYQGPADAGRNTDRRLVGSINVVKIATLFYDSPKNINSIEMSINNNFYTFLGNKKGDYGVPFEAVDKYVNGDWPKK